MTSVRFYTLVYVALLVLATAKVAFFELFDYQVALGLTLVSAAVKTALIAGYFQHLRSEPRSISYVMLLGLLAVLLLTSAAAFSIM